MLYQIEVKLGLARFAFQPAAGWNLTMHIDAMELGKGGRHARGKVKRASKALEELRALGVAITSHKLFGPVDVVAEHPKHGFRLVEVEGESKRQKEQALYSSLGQLLTSMKLWGSDTAYGVAVPDTREWVTQMRKIPVEVTTRLKLWRYLVKTNGGTIIKPGEEIPNWARG